MKRPPLILEESCNIPIDDTRTKTTRYGTDDYEITITDLYDNLSLTTEELDALKQDVKRTMPCKYFPLVESYYERPRPHDLFGGFIRGDQYQRNSFNTVRYRASVAARFRFYGSKR